MFLSSGNISAKSKHYLFALFRTDGSSRSFSFETKLFPASNQTIFCRKAIFKKISFFRKLVKFFGIFGPFAFFWQILVVFLWLLTQGVITLQKHPIFLKTYFLKAKEATKTMKRGPRIWKYFICFFELRKCKRGNN